MEQPGVYLGALTPSIQGLLVRGCAEGVKPPISSSIPLKSTNKRVNNEIRDGRNSNLADSTSLK